jgi:hypothetical protein
MTTDTDNPELVISTHADLAKVLGELLKDPVCGMIPDARTLARWIRAHYGFDVLGDFGKEVDRSENVLAAAIRMYLAQEGGVDAEARRRALQNAACFLSKLHDAFSELIDADDLQAMTTSDRKRFCAILARQNWGELDELRHWSPADEKLPLAHFWTEAGKAAGVGMAAPADAEVQP